MTETHKHSAATLTAELDALIARALPVSMGKDVTTDASALLNETNAVWSAMGDHAAELLPVVKERIRALKAELANAPEDVKSMVRAYEDAAAAARSDWIEPPRPIVAFMVLDAMERIIPFLESKAKTKR